MKEYIAAALLSLAMWGSFFAIAGAALPGGAVPEFHSCAGVSELACNVLAHMDHVAGAVK